MLFNVTCSKQYICSIMMVITDTLYFVDAKLCHAFHADTDAVCS